MKIAFNRHILSMTTIDSGVITPLMAVVHRFREPGSYHARVLRGEAEVGGFTLVVDRDAPLVPAQIDLGDIPCPVTVVNPETHVLFKAPGSKEGYAVVVDRVDAKGRSTAFDNRKLGEGDILMAILFRPGRYIATDEGGARCLITVGRPGKGMVRYIPSQKRGVIQGGTPLSIEYGKGGFRPERVEAGSSQGLTFMIRAPARIRISFEAGEEPGQEKKKKSVR